MRAGRLVIERVKDLVTQGKSFGLETTLAGQGYRPFLKRAKDRGYRISLFFVWLPKADLAVQRVNDWVKQGGHFVPERDIRRRYARGIVNFWGPYRALIDDWIIFDNATNQMKKIAYGTSSRIMVVEKSLLEVFLRGTK